MVTPVWAATQRAERGPRLLQAAELYAWKEEELHINKRFPSLFLMMMAKLLILLSTGWQLKFDYDCLVFFIEM